eukprot:CAMPEP_0185158962 /NCGR_PEP_ID=MMETSP1139-20130426/2747_1 /TAXON_ID=298111 /ORGANISM="Pavlova sp., Strain CCMP459" /LENGTH=56 /DNA_ID=CAMNT_0027724117 /DNA_START=140 /DNA_END=306 /DNA_ORIENTATION=-
MPRLVSPVSDVVAIALVRAVAPACIAGLVVRESERLGARGGRGHGAVHATTLRAPR